MATSIESSRIATHLPDAPSEPVGARVVPISTPTISMSAPSPGDPMEGTSPTSEPGHDRSHETSNGRQEDRTKEDNAPEQGPGSAASSMPAPPPGATGSVQTKVVQTAFIHKLYSMLEDSSISHLISWADSGESFVMSPSADFSKVLSQYFKHTNISSFVRQLNMYGFHKERDVFHTGHPESTLWEFKHGNGNFKRGDLLGLREIKRRASRHALVHRENNYPKATSSLPGTPAETMPLASENSDSRLAGIEHTLYELSTRLQRSEEAAHYMHVRNQAVTETMGRLLHFNQELSRTVLSLFPTESPQYRDILTLQSEIQKEVESVRTLDVHHEQPYTGRQQYFGAIDNAPVSPRQLAQDDSRRTNLAVPPQRAPGLYRPPLPTSLSSGARRPFGSIGGSSGNSVAAAATTHTSPLRNAAHAPPPERHPLSNVELPPGSLARRHTSADIREHGWGAAPGQFPPANTQPSPWPSSPGRAGQEVQGLRESLSSYSLQPGAPLHANSRPSTPPGHVFPQGGNNGGETFGNWSWGSATRDKLWVKDASAPPTRRGSMAHILNPSDTAERSDEDDEMRGDDDRKRKRRQ